MIGRDARGSHFGITVDRKIDHREVLHTFLITFRPLECFLEQALSFFPRFSRPRKDLVQLAPFLRQACILPRYLDSTGEERLQVLRMQCGFNLRASPIASAMVDQFAPFANSQGYGKSLWLDVLPTKIDPLLQILRATPPRSAPSLKSSLVMVSRFLALITVL